MNQLGRVPFTLVVAGGAGAAFLLAPLATLVLRAPWDRMVGLVGTEATLQALWLSVWTSTATTLLCLLVGLPLAWLLARVAFRGRTLLRALVTVPLVLPPVVGGVALLTAFGRSGVIGAPVDELLGVTIPYTTPAVVVAHTFVALPFFVLTAEGALRAVPERLELAASTLGASRLTTFLRVAVPLARPGILAGLVLAWARSLGEFGATITFAGNYPVTTRTMPLEVYTRLQADRDAAVALSVLLLGLCVLVLVLLRDRWLSGLVAAR